MIVLFILLTLAAVAVVNVQGYMNRAQKGEANLYISGMKKALEAYHLDHGHYPGSLQALLEQTEDVDPAKGEWPYIDDSEVRNDPWGMPYNYQFPGTRSPGKYDLWSSGPDMISGTDDDIGNWSK